MSPNRRLVITCFFIHYFTTDVSETGMRGLVNLLTSKKDKAIYGKFTHNNGVRYTVYSSTRLHDVVLYTWPALRCHHARPGIGAYCASCAKDKKFCASSGTHINNLLYILERLNDEEFALAHEVARKLILLT